MGIVELLLLLEHLNFGPFLHSLLDRLQARASRPRERVRWMSVIT